MSLNTEIKALFSDFSVDAVVGGVSCKGIFDEAYAETFGIVAGNKPSLLILSTVTATEGTAVVIGARSFTVTGVEPDGSGFNRLRLEAA